jgi:beta-glucanase (GH16 family)
MGDISLLRGRIMARAVVSLAMAFVCGAAALAQVTTPASAAPPDITVTPAQNGAVVVSLSSRSPRATIYYTVDGLTPGMASQIYRTPFLLAKSVTVKAVAALPGGPPSRVASQTFSLKIASGTPIWSEEFTNTSGQNARPDPKLWEYQTGHTGSGNQEQETYCGWNEATSPCSASVPNSYVGTDGYLHIVARKVSSDVYTSARLDTIGHFSLQYGRVEVRALVPEAQGLWPAAWLLGNNDSTVQWPACGEMDVLERVNAALTPDWNEGSVHGPGFVGSDFGTKYDFPAGQTAAQWHTYGMIWSKGSVSYYVDDPKKPYITYTPKILAGRADARWPFDSGQSMYIILNLAIGGTWPGSPDATTKFPAEMLVDYVRVYAE